MGKKQPLPPARPKLTSVIAQREYSLVTRDGRRQVVSLRFGKPRLFTDGRSYSCVYQIDGLEDGTVTSRLGGVDALQALHTAMQIALVDLVHTSAYREGRLTWAGSPDLGLLADDHTRALVAKASRSRQRPRRATGRRPARRRGKG